MLKKLIKLLKAINSNVHPGAIAHAVCMGAILGFMPKTNALWYILTVFFLFVRINKPALVLFTFLFSFAAPLADPLFDKLGYWFLTMPGLIPFFSKLVEIPFLNFTHFNATIVAGSLIFSIILYIPLYVLVRCFIKLWRTVLSPMFRKMKLVTYISKIPLIKKAGEIYVANN